MGSDSRPAAYRLIDACRESLAAASAELEWIGPEVVDETGAGG